MSDLTRRHCRELASGIRQNAVRMTSRANASHVGSALSCADILAVLYGSIMRLDGFVPGEARRDRFVMSKGHAAAALYACLSELGIFPREELETFGRDGSRLVGHVTAGLLPGVEASTGSLGHGLPISVGIALGATRRGSPYRTFCLISDGECDEGTTWEAALLAAQWDLSSLCVVIDRNGLQGLGSTTSIASLEPLGAKWKSFGWEVREVDGHSIDELDAALGPATSSSPVVVIAKTIKGKGVSFMENQLAWHYKSATGEAFDIALRELEGLQE
jgi:transketolase